MNIHAKVFAILIIGINVGCFGIDIAIVQADPSKFTVFYAKGNPHVATEKISIDEKDEKINIPGYWAEFTPSDNSIELTITDEQGLEKRALPKQTISPFEMNTFKMQIQTLFGKAKEAEKNNPTVLDMLNKGLLPLNDIEQQNPMVQKLYNEISTLIQQKFPGFIPIPAQIPIQATIHQQKTTPPAKPVQPPIPIKPIKLATSVDMHNMKIDQANNSVSIEYSNKSEPIATFNENVPISWYKVIIDKTNKTIRVELYAGDTGEGRTIHYANDRVLETITETLAQRKQNDLSMNTIESTPAPWFADLYDYIAKTLFTGKIFSEVTHLRINTEVQKDMERRINAMIQSTDSKKVLFQPAEVPTPTTIAPAPQASRKSWFNLEPLYQRAALFKKNYITPITRKLRQSPTHEILSTITGVGLGAGAVYLYYKYAKPSK